MDCLGENPLICTRLPTFPYDMYLDMIQFILTGFFKKSFTSIILKIVISNAFKCMIFYKLPTIFERNTGKFLL